MGTLSEPPVNLSQNPRETVIIWWLSFTLETIKQNMSEGVCEAGGCPEGGGGSYRLHHDYLRVPVPLEMWRSRRYCVLSGCLDPCLAGTASALCVSGCVSGCACDCLAVHLPVSGNCLVALECSKRHSIVCYTIVRVYGLLQ